MIRVLLDTHVLLWAWLTPEKLSQPVREILIDPNNCRLVSAVSAWEISVKYRAGKLAVEPGLVGNYQAHLKTFLAEEVAITSKHGLRAGQYLSVHRDPFDRLLAAQSELEGVPLVTRDPAFSQFPIQTLW